MNLPWKRKPSSLSPYLRDSNRLGDVIAAIQTMATYKFYKLSFAEWADRISADVAQADKWEKVFLEHPEFFRLDTAREYASLVWRRQFPKRYDVNAESVLTRETFYALPDEQKSRISRIPLPSSDIKVLIETAINLHSRALEEQKDKRWWVAIAGAAGGLVGAVVGAFLK
ncbi:MAG: N-carbamoyl-L-amino acid amidohydrolase [Betaproteobacteria bacterium]